VRPSDPVVRFAAIGAAQGAVESLLLFALSEKYTFSKDWFLMAMIILANATEFAVAAHYRVNLIGVALAGLTGMMVGGWLGVQLLGSYEYKVPTPREERILRIVTPQGEREVEVPTVPAQTIKKVPIGGGLGVLLGWAVGAGVYTWVSRPCDDEAAPDPAEDQTTSPV
jgi:hypothetical protein